MLKNLTNQTQVRTWRTPSPSSNTPIKSPRYQRVGLFRKDIGKHIKYESNNNDSKSKPMLHKLKNQLLQSKYQTNIDSNINNPQQYFLMQHASPKQQRKANKIQAYQTYFADIPPQKLQTRTLNSSTNKKHTNSSSKFNNKSQYQQQFIKLKQQNDKLKQQSKQLHQKYLHLHNYNEQILKQNKQYKKIIQNLKQKYQHKFKQQEFHVQQIQKLQNYIQNINKQLKKQQQQVMKLKDEIFQISMEKQNIILKYKNCTNINGINGNKKKDKNCQFCKQNNKLNVVLNNMLEGKMLEIGKKDGIINNLCKDLCKIQGELKNYQKPKGLINKMNNNLEEINDIVMKIRAKQLSLRFMDKQDILILDQMV